MQAGSRIDRFVVEERLGQGGMASVYRVRHATLGSLHALKVLDLRFAAVRDRLVLEGQVQARLAHPNIVAVTDLVQVEGAPGLILEYVPGPPLDVWLRDHRPDPATIDVLFRGILDGVAHAHRHDLVHRDLKPGNVLLAEVDGRLVPKVTDFGLAKLLSEDAPGRTRSGLAMGTPGYMAPEQIRSAKGVDRRADVFALGCLLYELWCGVAPFRGESVYDVLVAIEARDFVPARTIRPDLPEAVEAAIAGCIEPDPERRIASAGDLRERLYPGSPTAEPVALPVVAPGPSSPASSSTTGGATTAPSTMGPAPRPQRSTRSAGPEIALVLTVIALGVGFVLVVSGGTFLLGVLGGLASVVADTGY
jgi:serine/threonine protein kinase